MRRKLKLLGRAAKAGWAWGTAYTDHAGRVFTVLAVLVGTGTVSALSLGWWGPVAAVIVFALLALAVGALGEWDKAEKRIETDDFFQEALATFEERCSEHISKVERFLMARKTAGPPGEKDLARALRDIGAPEARQRRAEAEQYERETVAAFIESNHLDRGINLIDFLIEHHFVNAGTRKNVTEPKTIHDIEDGLLSIRWGAEHMPVYR